MKQYNKDQRYLIENNVEAMQLLTDLNLLTEMQPRPGDECVFHPFETEHHRGLASYWRLTEKHHDVIEDKDNGYLIIMLPKSKVPEEEAVDFFAHCISESSEGHTFKQKRVASRMTN